MLRKLIFSLVLAGSLTSAQAAQLNVEGTVLLNRGDGFQPVPSNIEVKPGDRIRVVQGSARIVYPNCYAVNLNTDQMAVVLANPPASDCGVFRSGGLKDGVAGVDSTTLIVGGGLLIGGGIGLTVLLLDPASP
jgi:hypothetical protein